MKEGVKGYKFEGGCEERVYGWEGGCRGDILRGGWVLYMY